MINIDSITDENNKEQNEKWPFIPDHPYSVLIIGGSGSGKTNVSMILTRWYWQNDIEQGDIDEFICMQKI